MKGLPCKTWKVGDHYIDCGYIPRVVVNIEYESSYDHNTTKGSLPYSFRKLKQSALVGRSLLDGTFGSCSIAYCAPQKVHRGIAERWAKYGPITESIRENLKSFYASDWGAGRKIWWTEN